MDDQEIGGIPVHMTCGDTTDRVVVPLETKEGTQEMVEKFNQSDHRLVCRRIVGHQRRVSIEDDSGHRLLSSETGDFEGSLPLTTHHVLSLWDAAGMGG